MHVLVQNAIALFPTCLGRCVSRFPFGTFGTFLPLRWHSIQGIEGKQESGENLRGRLGRHRREAGDALIDQVVHEGNHVRGQGLRGHANQGGILEGRRLPEEVPFGR